MKNTRTTESFLILFLTILASASQASAQIETQDDQVLITTHSLDVEMDSLNEAEAVPLVSAAFPTWWIGEYPPFPPYGYTWIFDFRDFYGRAHWYLARC